MKLSNFTGGRDNSFNLIRIVAALAVLITHSFALAVGSGKAEPFRESLGMTLGEIAVDVFFVTSGFLVTASLLTRQSALDFVWARFLRIFPALVVMVVLTVFGLGIHFTSVPLGSYLTDSRTYTYLVKCSTLIAGVAYNLPGVFEDNPYKGAVNGSLWTMPYELKMYAGLLAVWMTSRASRGKGRFLFQLALTAAAATAGAGLLLGAQIRLPLDPQFLRLFFMFFSGGAFYALKDYIELSGKLFWSFMLALLLSVMFGKLQIFFAVYYLTIAYLVFYLAYIPSGPVRMFNQLGDYSYGVYIYAFPIQQSIAALIPGVSVLPLALTSAAMTLFVSVMSWHVIERRALELKAHYVRHSRTILRSRRAARASTRPP